MIARGGREAAVVAIWTAAGAALRVLQIGAQSLWLDELFSVFVARRSLDGVIVGTMAGDTNPPLFNLLLHFALQFGSDETAARVVSTLFSIAAIPLFYVVAKQFFESTRAANVATALLVFSPFQIAYAQEARMYSQLAFFQLAALYFFQRAWNGGRKRDWLAFFLFEALAFYSHSLAALGLLALDVFALWRRGELRVRWRGWAASQLVVVVLFMPWAFVMADQAGRVLRGFWNPSSTVLNLLRTVYVVNFNSALPTLLVPLALVVTLLLFVLALYGVVRALARESLPDGERRSLELALAVTLVPPIALLLLSLLRPLFIERVLISCSFGLFLLWAWLWTQRPRVLDRAVLAVGGLLVVVALGNYYLEPQQQKPPMRAAAQALAARWQPGDVVVHTSDWSALAFDYYLPEVSQEFLSGDPAYADATTRGNSGLIAGLVPETRDVIVGGHSRIWLVVALEHSEAYQQSRVAEFDALYRLQDEMDVNRIYLRLYQAR